MRKQYLGITITMILLVCTGYIFSRPQYDTYDRRHKSAFKHIAEKNYRRAEWDLKQAIKLKPKKLDGYAALLWFYWEVAGESEKGAETTRLVLDMGFDAEDLDRVKSAYNKLMLYNAVYMTNTDDNTFIYYGHDGNPKRRDEIYRNGSYVYSKYNYENGRIVSETIKRHEGIYSYTWPKATIEYIYDQQGRLIQKDDPTTGWIKYYYDDNGNISLIDYQSKYSIGNSKTPYKEFYENGVLVKTQSSSGHDTINKETFYNADGVITRENTLKSDGSISKYYLYTYEKDGRREVTVCSCYYPDGVLDYRETATAVGVKPDKTVTEKYNYNGETVKITTELADGTVTEQRPSDNIPGARALTKEEIEIVNTAEHKLGWFTTPFDTPQDVEVNSIVAVMPATGQLTDQNKEELANLKKEGVELRYDDIEIELVHYVTYSKVRLSDVKAVLAEYINVPYEQLRKPAAYPYSQQYDCFYFSRLEASLKNAEDMEFICLGGEVGENTVKLYTEDRTMVMEKSGDKYYISAVIKADNSHLADKPEPAPTPAPTPTPQRSIEYEYVLKNQFLPRDASKGRAYNDAMAKYDSIIKTELQDYSDEYYPSFTLYELTNDGIPELVFQYMWGHMSIYSYINGEIKSLDMPIGGGGDGGKSLLKNGIVAGQMNIGYYNEYGFYTYNPDGSANKVEFSMYRESDKQEYRLEINGEEVTREEYNRFIQPYRKIYGDYAITPSFYPFDKIPVTE